MIAPRPSTAPAPLEDSLGRIPAATRVYDRVAYLIEQTRGRSVIHLGFVDARNMHAKLDHDAWLHAQLGRKAASLIGVDLSAEGVERARALGFEAYAADCQSAESLAAADVPSAELVVAGEIIEHLDNPGAFLDAVRVLIAPGGRLLITTPNPTALTNTVLGLMGREVQNADHVGWHSWRTLETLLGRHRYRTVELAYYRHPRFRPSTAPTRRSQLRCVVFNAYQSAVWPLLAAAPSLADGLIIMAEPLPA